MGCDDNKDNTEQLWGRTGGDLELIKKVFSGVYEFETKEKK